MTMYMFWQAELKTHWLPALATERDTITRTKKPALVSVLDVDNSFESDLTAEEARGVRYAGPFYLDFDASDLSEAITQFQLCLAKLRAKDVNLDMLRLYATGKKGFHIEVPPQLLMGKVPTAGTPSLPHIYREMAHSNSIYVDTLDFNVYSQRRGRMWRCPNVKREDNGQYKVQISAEEALTITIEEYSRLCASPRNTLPIEPPTLNAELGLIYAQARDKVDKAVAKAKTKKATANQLLRFKGEWPETIKGVLDGSLIKPGVGWNYISMQLAIVAAELGKTEEALLADSAGVIESHQGDSDRYGTPNKRRRDLQSMFRYMSGNPCHDYSVGAIMALLKPEAKANADIVMGDYVPDHVLEPSDAGESTDNNSEGTALDSSGSSTSSGLLKISSQGIFARDDEGYRNICDIGIQKQLIMAKLDGDQVGYEADVTLDNKPRGKRFLPMSALASRAAMNNWCLLMGASMRGTDTQVANLADFFRKSAATTVYAVEREGLDLITPPGAMSSADEDVIWAATDQVICLRPGVTYRYHGLHTDSGTYRTDLMSAPELTLDDAQYIDDLLQINTTQNIAKLLGWFSAAFLTQLIRKRFKRFPILQIFGQAGAGKSMTVILLNHLHYNMVEPRQLSVAGMTQFPIIAAAATSASLPLVFEEVKRRQISKHMMDFLQSMMRSNYTADKLARGSMGKDKSVKELTVTNYMNGAPIVFVGESLEDQSALLERCIVVALSKTDRYGRDAPFNRCLANATHMGRIGKALAMTALSLDRPQLYNQVNANFAAVSGKIALAMADDATRPAFNLAIAMTGLDFMRTTLARVFGDLFDARLEEMKASILNNVMDNIPRNLSEVSRVIDTMANLSRHLDDELRLESGVDYVVSEDGSWVELKVRSAFDKYVKYQRSLGLEVLFDSHNAWQTALVNYGGTVQRAMPGSVLYDSPRAVVFKLSMSYLDKEGVDSFYVKESASGKPRIRAVN
ncbi:MAG TPA: hypothetical protein PLJ73_07490 [Myxococcota bacterium]|nr:hypothetical protein [Myxococcota bacterium]